MNKVSIFIIVLFACISCVAQKNSSIRINCQKLYNFGKVKKFKNEHYFYLVAYRFENYSKDTQLILSDHLEEDYLLFVSERFAGGGYVSLRDFSEGLLAPQSKVVIYRIMGVPLKEIKKHNKKKQCKFVCMKYREFSSNKYDALVNEKKRYLVKRIKEEYGEDNPGNGVKIISMERFMETEGKVEIILLDKKKSRSDYYFCEFDLF